MRIPSLIEMLDAVLSKFGLVIVLTAGEDDPDLGYPFRTLTSRIMTKGAAVRLADKVRSNGQVSRCV